MSRKLAIYYEVIVYSAPGVSGKQVIFKENRSKYVTAILLHCSRIYALNKPSNRAGIDLQFTVPEAVTKVIAIEHSSKELSSNLYVIGRAGMIKFSLLMTPLLRAAWLVINWHCCLRGICIYDFNYLYLF